MAKSNTEFFIARRIAAARGSDSRNVMVRIATFTVAIGVAAMVVSMAVISGFKHELTAKLVSFSSHVQVTNLMGNSSLESDPIAADKAFEQRVAEVEGFGSINSYAIKGGIFKTSQAIQGVMLKGVDERFDWTFFESNLVAGQLPRVGDSLRNKDILIARSLAATMLTQVDDRVEMLFVNGSAPPRRDRFRVVGIYDSGMDEMDKMVIFTDLRNVQRLNNWSSRQITGYEISAVESASLESFFADIKGVVNEEAFLGQNLFALDLYSQYPNLFDWLKTHDVNGAVIITIILIVALLNMISALLIILLERTSMIGVLKALGMRNWAVQKIFIIRSSFIVIKGVLWGNVIAISLCLAQKYTGVVKLDQSGYFLSHVPIHFDWWQIVSLNVGTLVLITLLLSIPTIIVSSVKPEKTIRYQ